MQGKSLLPLIEGESLNDEYAFSGEENFIYSVRTKDWKFIKSGSTKELYNLHDDPKESNNVIVSNSQIATDLENKLNQWLVDCGKISCSQDPSQKFYIKKSEVTTKWANGNKYDFLATDVGQAYCKIQVNGNEGPYEIKVNESKRFIEQAEDFTVGVYDASPDDGFCGIEVSGIDFEAAVG